MTKNEAMGRVRRMMQTAGMMADAIDRAVMRADERLTQRADGSAEPQTASGAPYDVPAGEEPVDFLIADLLREVPVSAFRTAQAAALRYAALPHMAAHAAHAPTMLTIEQKLGMEAAPKERATARTLEEKLGVRL
jgi:hypothetical protein